MEKVIEALTVALNQFASLEIKAGQSLIASRVGGTIDQVISFLKQQEAEKEKVEKEKGAENESK